MGCGASSDKDDARGADKGAGAKEKGKSTDADANNRATAGAAAKYAESASPVPSEVEILLEEMDRRAPSHCSSAGDEPSEAVKAMRFKAAVTRGKVVNGMNEDPDQFAAQIDVPEFKRRDRRRVDEWTKLVAAAVAADGPEAIPEDSFFLTPSFSVAFTTSSSFQVTAGSATNANADGKPLEPAGRQRSSGGTNTHEFVDESTESFSARRENSSLDHVDSGDLTRNESGESARAALTRKQQHQQQQKQEDDRKQPGLPGAIGGLLPASSSLENAAAGAATINDDDEPGGQERAPDNQTDEVFLDQPTVVA